MVKKVPLMTKEVSFFKVKQLQAEKQNLMRLEVEYVNMTRYSIRLGN